MSDASDTKLTPAERVKDTPRITRALELAAREAVLEHKRAGNPVAVWRNDRVEWIAPEDIPTFEDEADEE
jgi:hypothetical protein